EYRTAPGSGCQLNCGRVSAMASPSGPNRANPVLAPDPTEGEACPRDRLTSVSSSCWMMAGVATSARAAGLLASRASRVGMLDAGGAVSDCATDTAGVALLARGFVCPHQRAVATAAARTVATEAAWDSVTPRRRLPRASSRRSAGSGRWKPDNSLLKV